MFVWLIGVSAAAAGTLSEITLKDDGQALVVTLAAPSDAAPSLFVLGGEHPRLVIDLSVSEISAPGQASGGQTIVAGTGIVSQIRYAPRADNSWRLVFDLVQAIAEPAIEQTSGGWIVTLPSTGTADELKIADVPTSGRSKPIIVIDPGHGGKDPGTHSAKGTNEKDINLLAALLLKAMLEKTGRYEVVLTRSDDRFIELEDRVTQARLAEADLFISLHADAGPSSDIRGASVYTLASRADKRSDRLASSQNWVMSTDLSDKSDEVSDILVDLAQRKTRGQSAEFAEILIGELKPVTPLLGKTHRQAGLYVLLAPDVPAVLLEMGFLSNAEDEANLLSVRQRTKMMEAVVKAIDIYFAELDPQPTH